MLFSVFLNLLVVLCILWAQPAAAIASTDNWPMFNHDLVHTGYSTSFALEQIRPSGRSLLEMQLKPRRQSLTA